MLEQALGDIPGGRVHELAIRASARGDPAFAHGAPENRVCYPEPMARARLGDYLVGVEGLALRRHWLGGDPAAAQERIAEIGRFLGDPGLLGAGLDVPELDAQAGYAAWSGRYDEVQNPLIRVEEPVV